MKAITLVKKSTCVAATVTMTAVAMDLSATAEASETVTAAAASSTASLEVRLREMETAWKQMEADRRRMETQMQDLRAELAKVKAEAETQTQFQAQAAVERDAAKQAALTQERAADDKEKKHMVFFRGGYPAMVNSRANQLYTDAYARDNNRRPQNKERDGVYFGAGVDLSVSDDLFGLMDETEFMAELMFDWKRWDSHDGGFTAIGDRGAISAVPYMAAELGLNPYRRHLRGVTLSQWTISASPKIKFFKGSDFRPWIIPAGMAFNIISPPSDSNTFVAPGVMFGLGFDYRIWDNLFFGMNGRYDWVANEMDGVKASYYQVGGFIGAGF